MKRYQIFIQDNLYKTVESEYVSDILKDLSVEIQNGQVTNLDNTKPASIKIVPVS
jgi:hypothetical protein